MSLIPRDEFDAINMMVQAVFDEGRHRSTPVLKTVSTNVRHMPACHYKYLASTDSLGVAMGDLVDPDNFHLWINPSYMWASFKYYMTIAHELTHGYAGLQYGHSPHWRRWFYRVLFHLIEAEMIPSPESEVGMLAYSVERCYNHTNGDLFALPVEAISKAKSEHSRVLDNYWKRISA